MIMKPVVALIPADVETLLIPLIDQIAASIRDNVNDNPVAVLTMRLNGWSYDMLAWGRIITAAAECGIEVGQVPE